MQQAITTLFFIGFTLGAYILIRRLYMRFNHPLLNVVALSAAVVIGMLVGCGFSYEQYAPAKNIMTVFLGPATVGLALPLYRYRLLLKRAALAILCSVTLGSLTAMVSATVVAKLGGLPEEVIMSILPKGVSIPFAVELAQIYNGIPPLTAAFVVATGTLGSLLGAWTLDTFKITDPVARGLSLGTVSHAQGTATALLEGELPGAMGGLAMILAGILTVVMSPLAIRVLDCIP